MKQRNFQEKHWISKREKAKKKEKAALLKKTQAIEAIGKLARDQADEATRHITPHASASSYPS